MKEVKYINMPADSSVRRIEEETSRLYVSHGITILRHEVFDSVDDAKNYLDRHSNIGGRIAVRYRCYPDYTESTGLMSMKKQLDEAREEWWHASMEQHYTPDSTKWALVGCRGCGSRISVAHLDGNLCPVCGDDLRPEGTLKRIRTLRKKFEALSGKTDMFERIELERWESAAEIRLLARIEVYSLPETKYRWLRTVSDDGTPYLYLDGCFRYRDMETDHIEIHCNEDADNTYDVYLNLWHITMCCDAPEDGDGNRIESSELYCDIFDENSTMEEAEKNLVSLDRAPKISSVTAWG